MTKVFPMLRRVKLRSSSEKLKEEHPQLTYDKKNYDKILGIFLDILKDKPQHFINVT